MVAAPAFVTGGSSGIGLAIARRLAANGHPLALMARDARRLAAAADAIRAALPAARVAVYPVDVADPVACSAAVEDAVTELGRPGIAVASAGIAVPGFFLDQDVDLHRRHMEVNYFGTLHFAHAVATAMASPPGPGGGHLVLVSSAAAFVGIYGYAGYAPSKFAVRGLAEVLRVELAPHGIVVTLACPGDTDTPMLVAEERTKPEATKRITAGGGVRSAEDVADRILHGMRRGRFLVAPGHSLALLAWGHSLLGPALRAWQRTVVRGSER